MIVIYCAKYNGLPSNARLYSDTTRIPESVYRKAASMRHVRDAYHHVMGRWLLSFALESSGLSPSLVHFVKVTDDGRPYLASHKIDFNISHSGDMVVCAFSDECQLGIDVEEIIRVNFEDFGNQFSHHEWNEILHDSVPLTRFYMLWSRKEAVIKADGRGLQHDLATVDVLKNVTVLGEKKWFLLDVPIGDTYKMSLAAERPVASCDVKLEWIEL